MLYQLPPHEQIAAIIPSYSPQGDHAAVISTDGLTANTASSVRTLIRRLAYSRSTDLIALKARAAAVTRRSILQPLALTPGLVLVPVKVRKPRIAGDTSTGYVNLHAITAVLSGPDRLYRSILALSGGVKLPVLWSPATVHKQLQYARLTLSHLPLQPAAETTPASYAAITGIAAKVAELICDILKLKLKS